MENFNVLVLMEKDANSGFLTETIDSYTIDGNMGLIEGIYLLEENEEHFVYLTLTTQDVEDWEYYGMYELYDEEIFEGLIVEVLDGSGEFNPQWILKLKYNRDRVLMEELLNKLLKLHETHLQSLRPILEENKQKYMEESEQEEQ